MMNLFDGGRRSPQRNILIAVALGIVLILALIPVIKSIVGSNSAQTSAPATQRSPIVNRLDRGLYSGAITDAEGDLDINRTIARTVAVHANTYYYLIWDRYPSTTFTPSVPKPSISQDLWKKLPLFAAAAARQNINVVVYLVPPTESVEEDYLPFHWDYNSWFREIGHLASVHHNVVGIAIDDLAGNFSPQPAPHRFTLDEITSWRAAARAPAPWMKVYAVLYARDILGPGGVLPNLRPALDGVIYPFAGPDQASGALRNTTDASGLARSVFQVRGITSCGGLSSCSQLILPRGAAGSPGQTVSASAELIIKTAASALEVRFADDRVVASQGAYDLQVSVDGRALKRPQRTEAEIAHVVDFVLPTALRAGMHTVQVKLSRRSGSDRTVVVIQRIGVARSTNQIAGALRQVGQVSPGDVTTVRPSKLEVMFYCARFGAEGNKPGAADAGYLRALVPGLRDLISNGFTDGLVAYRLNLSGTRQSALAGDLNNFSVVQKLFRSIISR